MSSDERSPEAVLTWLVVEAAAGAAALSWTAVAAAALAADEDGGGGGCLSTLFPDRWMLPGAEEEEARFADDIPGLRDCGPALRASLAVVVPAEGEGEKDLRFPKCPHWK